MTADISVTPRGWLAFEQNVLHRLSFASASIPVSVDPEIALYMKRRGVAVATNSPLLSAWITGVARVQNDNEELSSDDVDLALEEAYVPGYKLQNASLTNWFSEVDAWWFDNVRRNIERLSSPFTRSLAGSLAIATGDYALSFTEETRELRQPLSTVFRRLWSIEPPPVGGNSTCSNKSIDTFLTDPMIMERYSDLMFLRLPPPHSRPFKESLGRNAWREEWIRNDNSFWPGLDDLVADELGGQTETRSQYLRLVERTLGRATYMKKWAIAHVESGFISTQDIADTISEFRRVETIYTKDLTELMGVKAVIIVA